MKISSHSDNYLIKQVLILPLRNIFASMENRPNIYDTCQVLNNKIHQSPYFDVFLLPDNIKHSKAFTSIDLIEDSQFAIYDFTNLPDHLFTKRSTLYIYGVMQALYCQQDGLQHLFECVFDCEFKDFNNFVIHFNSWPEVLNIRLTRNDIAGHPTNRKKGKEFFFISKRKNTEYTFEYGGYAPKFK